MSALILHMATARNKHIFDRQQARHQGLGTADTTKEQWLRNVYRDTYASMAGHAPLLAGLSVAFDEPPSRTKQYLLDQMLDPKIPK